MAAHQVGLVHRDFKPENVLIGLDGRPRVADFGLVHSDRLPMSDEALLGLDPRRSITVEGVAAGTPRYMAPEQWNRRPVGPRTDLFAFSVALWEALTGAPPFRGATPLDLKVAVLTGKIQPPSRALPRWLERTLRRGMAANEADRWPSMQELIRRLEEGLASRRQGLVAAGLAVVLAALAVLLLGTRRESCPAPDDRAAAVWSEARRRQLAQRLASVDPTRGVGRLDAVAPAFERAVADFSAKHVEACRATRAGRQSDLLLARRLACLDDWLSAVDARVAAFESARDPAAVDVAAQNALDLPPLAACADVEALSAASSSEAEAQARGLEAKAEALLEAEDPAEIGRVLDALLDAAARAHDDRRAANAWLLRLRVETSLVYRPDRGLVLFPAAEAAVTRAGNPLELRVALLEVTAGVLHQLGRAPEALARLGEAELLLGAAGAHQAGSPLALALADVWRGTGSARLGNREPLVALARFDAAAALLSARLGPDHPRLVDVQLGRSEAFRQLGRMEDSLAAAGEALRIRRLRQPGTPALAETLSHVGGAANELSRFEEARAFLAEAEELGRRVLPADSVRLALILTRYAGPLRSLGRIEEAARLYDEAIAIQERRGNATRSFALTYGNRADYHRSRRRCEEAVADYRRAIAMLDEVSGPGSVFLIQIAFGMSDCLQRLGRPGEALPYLEAAVAVKTDGYLTAVQSIDRMMLGSTLVESKQDLARGHALVDQARAELAAAKEPWAATVVAEIDAWRKKYPRPLTR
jgi:tetratricopeptide (TPR) repeat protein